MLGKENLTTLASLQALCSTSSDPDEINRFLRQPCCTALLDALGIHVCIFGYRDVDDPSGFYYLTDAEGSEKTQRNVKWPYRIDDKNGSWSEEDPSVRKTRFELAGAIRRYEYARHRSLLSTTLSTLESLSDSSTGCLTSMAENQLHLLYVPMGEILCALLKWHLSLLAPDTHIVYPGDLKVRASINDQLQQCDIYRALKHIAVNAAQSDPGRLAHFPSIALLEIDHEIANRDITWGEILLDLGLCNMTDGEWTCNLPRLRAISKWILMQSDPESQESRPGVVFQLSPGDDDILLDITQGLSVSSDVSWEALNVVARIVRASTGFTRPDKAAFGFANHLFWMTAGRNELNHWAEPYDWIVLEVLPKGNSFPGHSQSMKPGVQGIAFLTIRSSCADPSDPLPLLQRLLWIKALVFSIATFENHFTFYETIRRSALEGRYYRKINAMLSLWIRSLYHDVANQAMKVQGCICDTNVNLDTIETAMAEGLPVTREMLLTDKIRRAREYLDGLSDTIILYRDILSHQTLRSNHDGVEGVMNVLRFIEDVVIKMPIVANEIEERGLPEPAIDLPSDWCVPDNAFLKVAVIALGHNAAKHALPNTHICFERDNAGRLVIANTTAKPKTNTWKPLQNLQTHKMDSATGGEGIRIALLAAELLGQPPVEYRVDNNGILQVAFTLPTGKL